MTKNNQQPTFDSQNPVIYDNTRSELILVMPDTLDNRLRDLEEYVRNKGNIPYDLGLIFAFLGTLLTVSEFKNFLNIPSYVWQALFLLFLIFSVVKLCYDAYNFFVVKSTTRHDILKQLLDETRKKK